MEAVINELNELFKQPKTLRSMKYTSWSDTTNHKDYEFKDFYVGTNSQDHHEYFEIFKELGKCISEGGDMSEELLTKFVFSGDFGELLYSEKAKQVYKPKPSWCCKEVWDAELEKYMNSIDLDVIKMNDYFERTVRTKTHSSLTYNENIYDETQSILVERYGIKSMTFEERKMAEIRNNKRLITKSGFLKLIKALSGKQIKLKEGEDSVMDLYFNHDVDGDDYIQKIPPYCKSGGLAINTLITKENVFKKKSIILQGITRDENNTLYIPKMFKIISKNQKLYTEGIKGANDKKEYANKPFEPFEKCGVEVVYVRLGYKSDGTKQGNRNRGTLECLKDAYKMNMCGCEWSEKKKEYVKIKGLKMPSKKDELTKVLLKM